MFSYEEPGLILLRAAIIFAVCMLVMRLMGNRAIGQFSPFDFVLMIGIGDILGAVALETETSLIDGAEALAGIFILQQILSRASLRSPLLRRWLEGTPVIVIQDGKLIRENLVKTNFNIDDLRQELHRQGLDIKSLPDIKLARLESTGEFTVVINSEVEPVTYEYFKSKLLNVFNNPLSRSGTEFVKFRQFVEDLEYLSDYAEKKKIRPSSIINDPPNVMQVKT